MCAEALPKFSVCGSSARIECFIRGIYDYKQASIIFNNTTINWGRGESGA